MEGFREATIGSPWDKCMWFYVKQELLDREIINILSIGKLRESHTENLNS